MFYIPFNISSKVSAYICIASHMFVLNYALQKTVYSEDGAVHVDI
jgi:hypothetical protein